MGIYGYLNIKLKGPRSYRRKLNGMGLYEK